VGLGRGCRLRKTFPKKKVAQGENGARKRMWAGEKTFLGKKMGWGRDG
jgi:hypothetical protein